MKIMVVSFFFPPVSQVGYRRPLRFVEHFRRQGHEVSVFCVHPSTPGLKNYSGIDPALSAKIPAGVRVYRTPSFHGFKILLAIRDGLRNKNGGVPPAAAVKSAPVAAAPDSARSGKGLAGRLVDSVMELFGVPDPYWGWIVTTLPMVLLDHARGKAQAIYVTGPPWSPMILGAIAGRMLGIPVFLDFRDPWTLNRYWKGHPASRYLESKVLASGKAVITNTASMEKGFLEAFPGLEGRIRTIYNGFEPGVMQEMQRYRDEQGQAVKTEFIVSHIGMLYPSRMPASLAKAFATVAAQWKGPRPIVFRFLGQVMDPAPLIEAFATAGVPQALQLVGEVSTSAAKREEVKADVLLLLQSGTQDQIPAKAFEYVFAGPEILCVADPGSETASLLERHGLGTVFNGTESAAAFAAVFGKAAEGRAATGTAPESFMTEFEGERLSARMLAVLTEGSVRIPSAGARR
ncbi:MAG: putative Glycosyl transferase [Fibrobacteres bacterium]|nr:putative Glycosyl transferase [Fibrobacterota bacterium]